MLFLDALTTAILLCLFSSKVVDSDSPSSEGIILGYELEMADLDPLSSEGIMLDCVLVMADSDVIALK